MAHRPHRASRLLVWPLLLALGAAALVAAPPLPSAPSATPPGGTVRALAADPFAPGHLELGTSTGAVFRSDDGGAHWRFQSSIAGRADWVVAGLAPDPGQAGHWYAALWSVTAPQGGVFASSDGGQSWQPLLAGHPARAVAIAPSDPNTLVAAALDGVYRSQDRGASWSLISPANFKELVNIESVAIDPANPAEIYVGTWHLPWKTFDGGHNWVQLNQGVIDDSDVFSIAIDRARPATVFLSACSGIYRSDTSGVQFRKIQGIPYTARRTRALVQDPLDPATVYAGTTQGLWITRDSGATWTRATSPGLIVNAVLPLPAAAGQPPGERILLGTEFGGVYASADGGASFHLANDGFSNRHVSAVAEAPGERFEAVTGDGDWGGIFSTRDGGAAWTQESGPLPGADIYALQWTGRGLLAGTERGVFLRAPASGAAKPAWKTPPGAPPGRVYGFAASSAAVSDSLAAPAVFAAADSGLYRSLDGGATWQRLRAAPAPIYQVLAPPVSGWVLVAGAGFVLRSPDRGEHFVPGSLYLDGRVNQLAWAPRPGADPLLLAATTLGLYQSGDRGQTWSLSGHGLPQREVLAIHAQSDGIYIATGDAGPLYRSTDGGTHWAPVSLPGAQRALAEIAPAALDRWQPQADAAPGAQVAAGAAAAADRSGH